MSGDKDQEYFSDGLTEELLNSLAEVRELQVAARTSAFSFKGTNTDIGTIARKLNVGTVLEGSVRRSGHTVRVTAQLNNAVTGFHLWSHTYDRNLGDVLKLETEIAEAVASALKVSLLSDVAAKIELGGTQDAAALDAYLRGSEAFDNMHDAAGLQQVIAAYTDAIRHDPGYARAFAARSIALSILASYFSPVTEVAGYRARALADAQHAIAQGPALAAAHRALALYFHEMLDFARAREEYERAAALAPGEASTLHASGWFAVLMGRTDGGILSLREATALDPLNFRSHLALGAALLFAHRYGESIGALQRSVALHPTDDAYALLGADYVRLGALQSARTSCETKVDSTNGQTCLAIVYDKLGRHADAEAQLARLRAARGDAYAFEYAGIYAQWGRLTEAMHWLDTAVRLRSSRLTYLKVEPEIDPLRKEPRFQAIERELKFPD
jgi:TolB-like protein